MSVDATPCVGNSFLLNHTAYPSIWLPKYGHRGPQGLGHTSLRNLQWDWGLLCLLPLRHLQSWHLPLACYIMTLNSGLAVQASSGVSKAQLKKVIKIALQQWPKG